MFSNREKTVVLHTGATVTWGTAARTTMLLTVWNTGKDTRAAIGVLRVAAVKDGELPAGLCRDIVVLLKDSNMLELADRVDRGVVQVVLAAVSPTGKGFEIRNPLHADDPEYQELEHLCFAGAMP